MHRITGITVLLVLSAISTSAVPPSFSYGTMHASCAPWDGPAIEIRLTEQPAQCNLTDEPYVSLAIWRGLPIHAGQVVKIGPGSNAGWAARCAKADDCKPAQSATLVFDKYEEQSSAAGHYELHFKDGETLEGAFDAKWCKERVVCG